jgi:predicted lipoprotein with Yx(FWY)xxD motif
VRAPRPFAGFALITTLIVAACTGGSTSNTSPAAAIGSVTIGMTSSGDLGTFLTGPDGKTLYIHAGDSASTSTCTGACLTAWPPLTVAVGQQPTAAEGVTGQLGTFAGPDGTKWVTYNGLPLYYWQGDTKSGDATGQGVNGFSVAKLTGSASGSKGGAGHPAATSAPGGGYYP